MYLTLITALPQLFRKRNRRLALCLALLSALLGGCEKAALRLPPERAICCQLLDEEYTGDLRLVTLQLEPGAKEAGAHGVTVKCELRLSRLNTLMLRSFDDLDYDAYLLKARLYLPDGTPVAERSAAGSEKTMERKVPLAGSLYQQPLLFLPFRLLALPPGEQELVLEITGYPAKISQQMGKGYHKNEQAQTTGTSDLRVRTRVRFTQPEVFRAQLEMQGFRVNEQVVDPSRFDYRLTGPGYPDLCWQLFLGPDRLYKSAVQRNRVRYTGPVLSAPFLVAAPDELRLNVLDEDEMSAPDLIGSWQGAAGSLSQPAVLAFDSVTDVQVHLRLEPLR